MFRTSREPIKPPNDHSIKLPLAGRAHQLVQLRPGVLRARLPDINKLSHEREAASRAEGPQVAKLKLTILSLVDTRA